MSESKTCPKCGEAKALAQFARNRSRLDGLQSRCRPCRAADGRDWRAANPARVRAYRSAHRAANPEKVAAWQTRLRVGLCVERAIELGRRPCEICASPPGANARAHHIDHDHSMNGPASVRGTLCSGCNTALGKYERMDDWGRTNCPAWRVSAQQYLDRHAAR